jgi:hypothetical protein
MKQDSIDKLNKELMAWHKWFNSGSKQWGLAYHFCLYGTTIITLLIGFLTQIDFEYFWGIPKNILIALLAFFAAGFSSLIAKGGLDRKWKSNRINRGKIEQLQLDLLMDGPDYEVVIAGLNEEKPKTQN